MTQLFTLLTLAVWVLPSEGDTVWPPVPGRLLPPFLRHIGVMPLGEPGLATAMKKQYSKNVTEIVSPYDEVERSPSEDSPSRLLVDLGNWEFANREALNKRIAGLGKSAARFSGWILNGDVGSMVTNLKEFAEFHKQLNGVRRDLPLLLACRYQKGAVFSDCLPKSLEPYFQGVIWDVHFPLGLDPACLGKAANCAAEVAAFFTGLQPCPLEDLKRDQKILSWSFRLPLAALAQAGDPLRLLKAFFAYFVNEPRSAHFLVAMDGSVSQKVVGKQEPYAQVGAFLANLSAQQNQRNLDIGSDIENPLATAGRVVPLKKARELGKNGREAEFAGPYFVNRFSVRFKAADRPTALSLFGEDGEGNYYLGRWVLPRVEKSGKPPVLFTETFHFPFARRIQFFPEKGRLTYAGGEGWPAK